MDDAKTHTGGKMNKKYWLNMFFMFKKFICSMQKIPRNFSLNFGIRLFILKHVAHVHNMHAWWIGVWTLTEYLFEICYQKTRLLACRRILLFLARWTRIVVLNPTYFWTSQPRKQSWGWYGQRTVLKIDPLVSRVINNIVKQPIGFINKFMDNVIWCEIWCLPNTILKYINNM